ncbi:putative hydrolase YutF [Komagataeibacter europaeus]|uniref:Hydrolase YutF n=1 Tax=Komagataeibacter europaeus TaxID=33995 RepID=A0A0M0ELV6_KOMEU|nr:TIGR01459 family HAD-type hydrolase [Komagataeibacter europaeus]KON66237.1 putative hydrolase YutF [Komagataeibacter europaeus]GBQ39954.1 hydrolase IIA [Komagataeibacter europaeus LMG 18890]
MKWHDGLSTLNDDYDGYILDLWGVVHNGVQPYPGVLECLQRLREAGRRVVLLSNAPRRTATVEPNLRRMGVSADLYDAIMTSGECTHRMLSSRDDPWFAALGRRMIHLGPEKDVDVYAGLDLDVVTDPAHADFVLNTGPDAELGEEDIAPYLPLLERCAVHGLPMICANPDQQVIRGTQRLICAGAMAGWYAEHGRDVRWIGKPYPEVYGLALSLLDVPRDRVLALGDALATDMRGAATVGIDGCWVLGGIHQEMLGGSWAQGRNPDYDLAVEEATAAGLAPVACVPSLRW